MISLPQIYVPSRELVLPRRMRGRGPERHARYTAGLGAIAGNRRRAAIQSAYVTEVLTDTPTGYYRLNQSAPSGAGTVLDSSGNGNHLTPPGSGITWNQRGAIGDGSGAGAEFLFTSSIDAGVLSSLLADHTWTIELWYYPQPSSSSSGGGYLISGASDSTHKVAIQHTSNTFFSTSNAGGNRSSFTSVSRAWNHVVVTSGGAMYINGVAQGGTGSASTLSTVGMIIGGRQNGTEFARGRFAEVAFYPTALSEARILAHYAAGIAITLPAGRFFYWDMEQNLVNETVHGVDDYAQLDQGATLSTAQAYSGTQSLSVGGGTYRSATWDHPHNSPGFCNLAEGTIRFAFRYTGTIPSTFMAWQITGKDRTGLNEIEDGINFRFSATYATFNYSWNNVANGINLQVNTTIAADVWHVGEVKWRTGTTPTMSVTVDGVTATSDTAFGAWGKPNASHRLIGNDLISVPTGMWVDVFETFGSWQ
jgi:hypothetical protein